MLSKFIIYFLLALIPVALFIAFRFGLFEQLGNITPPTINSKNIPKLSPTVVESLIPAPPSESSTNTMIWFIDPPAQASVSQQFAIRWFVDNDKIATISHTAIHYGKSSKSQVKLPSDYPEKSIIFKGTIPATFSAELSIEAAGLYYYRAHALVADMNIWSDEVQIHIKSPASPAATPIP